LKILSKTRVARPHFSVRPKLRRAWQSLDVVTSSVLGKIRWRKILNMAFLIVGETFLTNSIFLFTIEVGCSRAVIFIQLSLEGDTFMVEVKYRVCKEREPSKTILIREKSKVHACTNRQRLVEAL
jgi:hypothetical protein